jgi:hypothetical protein
MNEALELPVPPNEDAIDDDEEGVEALEEEDSVDEPEDDTDDEDVRNTWVPVEDLETDDFLDVQALDEGDAEAAQHWEEHGPSALAASAEAAKAQVSKVTKHLTAKQRTRARRLAVKAVIIGLNHKASVHYTQGGQRWQGIDDTRYAVKGEYPNFADCSAYDTWALWNGLYVAYKKPDVVNGANWRAGFTGTMLGHGRPIRRLSHVRWGDLVLYRGHVAMVVKVGKPRGSAVMVVSHGSEPGPFYLPYNYRSDIVSIRRYIHYKV